MVKGLNLKKARILYGAWMERLVGLFSGNERLMKDHSGIFVKLSRAFKEYKRTVPVTGAAAVPVPVATATKGPVPVAGDATLKKRKNDRRIQKTRPTTLNGLKDRATRDKFRATARAVTQLQLGTTFEERTDNDLHPKSKHFMFTYDELVKKPHYSGREKKRADPICAFLTPDKHVDTSELGVILINAGIQMVRGSMEGVAVTSDEVLYYNTVFGINVHSNNKGKGVTTGTKEGSTEDM